MKINVQTGMMDFYEKESVNFFQTVFDTDNLPLVTDLSQLYDFSTFATPPELRRKIEIEVRQEEAKNPSAGKAEQWRIYSKVHNKYWDKWILEKIKTEFHIEVPIDILMTDLFRKMNDKARELYHQAHAH